MSRRDSNPESEAEQPDRSLVAGFDAFGYQVLSQIPDSILVVDDLGVIVFTNHAAKRLFKLKRDRSTPLPIAELIPNWTELPARGFVESTLGTRRDGAQIQLELSIGLARTCKGLVAVISVRPSPAVRPDALKTQEETKVALQEELQQSKNRELLLHAEIDEAARLLESYLPAKHFESPTIDTSWSFSPCQTLGGDMIRLHRGEGGHITFSILDVSGHGLSSALLSVNLAHRISRHLVLNDQSYPRDPATVLTRLNKAYQTFDDIGLFVTMIHGFYDSINHQITYACAGHPHPILFGPDSSLEVDGPILPPLGITQDVEYQEQRISLEPGVRAFIYTDGVTESQAPTGELYGEERLLAFLAKHFTTPLKNLPEILNLELSRFRNGPGRDDVTTLFLEPKQ